MRRVKEGASAVLLQSGLNESWWADSMECYTYLRNVTDLTDGKTPNGRRFGKKHFLDRSFRLVHWLSLLLDVSSEDQSRIHQFSKNVLLGIFFGYCRSTALYSSSPRNRRTSSSVCKAGALVSPSSCLDGEPHGWVPVDTHSTPVPSMTGEAVGGLCSIRAQSTTGKCATRTW